MKKFIIIGAILAGAAVWVLIAHQEVFTETKHPSTKAIITVEIKTGKILSVKNESGDDAVAVTPDEITDAHNKGAIRYLSTINHVHLSPGCVWVRIRGWPVKICDPNQ
jgi:hypothetical protein